MSLARWRTVLTLGAALGAYFVFVSTRGYPPLLGSAVGAAIGGLTYYAFNTVLRLRAIYRRERVEPSSEQSTTDEHPQNDRSEQE